MNKSIKLFPLGMAVIIAALTGCTKEPLNAECDIEGVSMTVLKNPQVSIYNRAVDIKVPKSVDITNIALEFVLTPGATIYPPSGTSRNFTLPQVYTVTSEDRQWKKEYIVSIDYMGLPTEYNFENIYLQQYGQTKWFYEVFEEYTVDENNEPILNENNEPVVAFKWASGNEGFAWTGLGKNVTDYPTFQSDNGMDGKCVCMITRKTGNLGNMQNKPLAAGNLFMGLFDMSMALKAPLKSTKFGVATDKIPLVVEGYYKYTPGETYCELDKSIANKDRLKPIPGKIDEFNIIGVMFDNTMVPGGFLDATNMTAEDNEAIISVAKISDADRVPSKDWKYFKVNFVTRPGKSVDTKRLQNGDYSIFLVFTSSINGDYFSGAEGSTLYIDKVKLICEDPTE